MRVTALEMSRRAFLMALAAPLLAEGRQEIMNLLTAMASALSEGDGMAFLDYVDHSMRDYEKLARNILALTAQNEVASSIDLLKEDGDEHSRSAELDWFLQIRSREQTGPLERRRQTVKCGLERGKKKWKIVSLEPVSFFAPPA
jgi:hypothetical protein